jgi:hypothetical protein
MTAARMAAAHAPRAPRSRARRPRKSA